jgi:hypothetical protein
MTERSGRKAAGVTDAGEGPTSGAAATGSGSEDSTDLRTPARGLGVQLTSGRPDVQRKTAALSDRGALGDGRSGPRRSCLTQSHSMRGRVG